MWNIPKLTKSLGKETKSPITNSEYSFYQLFNKISQKEAERASFVSKK